MSSRSTAGPDTITSGQHGWVVVTTPRRLKRSSSMASTAASTTSKCSGLHPAIAALAATTSTVAAPPLGGMAPKSWPGSRPEASTRASTADRVGGYTGSPSVNPSAWANSTHSSMDWAVVIVPIGAA